MKNRFLRIVTLAIFGLLTIYCVKHYQDCNCRQIVPKEVNFRPVPAFQYDKRHIGLNSNFQLPDTLKLVGVNNSSLNKIGYKLYKIK